jgi:hypothetical protein
VRNLAGNRDCDVVIRAELDEAGVPRAELRVPLEREVAASVVGQLGPFRFERAWYYWVVNGNVPLMVAEEMYATEIGKRDVRVVGHCACPPPAEWAKYMDADGKKLVSDPDGTQETKYRAFSGRFGWPDDEAPRFVPCAKDAAAAAYVTSYHIDSQEGLALFAETMRRHGLDKVER